MAKMNCAICTKCLKLERHHHHKDGVAHTECSGFVCLVFASEDVAIWITGLDPNKEHCEEFSPKENVC